MKDSMKYNKNTSKESKIEKNNKPSCEKEGNISYRDTNELSKNKSFKFPLELKSKYEIINKVSETGDSIYSYTTDDIMTKGKEQIFISLSEIKKIVNEELDKRLEFSFKK